VLEESDLRAGLREGGQVLGAFIIARADDDFVIYMRASWGRGRGFRIVRTWRGASGDRSFKNLHSAWCFIRKFDFRGHVMVYPVGDVELRQFVGVVPHDLGISPGGSNGRAAISDPPDPMQPPAMVAAPDSVEPANSARPARNAAAISPISAGPPTASR
jgi:hypothetical protein